MKKEIKHTAHSAIDVSSIPPYMGVILKLHSKEDTIWA
jgi:hypothetical protein